MEAANYRYPTNGAKWSPAPLQDNTPDITNQGPHSPKEYFYILSKDLVESILRKVVCITSLNGCQRICQSWNQLIKEKKILDRCLTTCIPEESLSNY